MGCKEPRVWCDGGARRGPPHGLTSKATLSAAEQPAKKALFINAGSQLHL